MLSKFSKQLQTYAGRAIQLFTDLMTISRWQENTTRLSCYLVILRFTGFANGRVGKKPESTQ